MSSFVSNLSGLSSGSALGSRVVLGKSGVGRGAGNGSGVLVAVRTEAGAGAGAGVVTGREVPGGRCCFYERWNLFVPDLPAMFAFPRQSRASRVSH